MSELVSDAAKSPPRPRPRAVAPTAGPATNRPCSTDELSPRQTASGPTSGRLEVDEQEMLSYQCWSRTGGAAMDPRPELLSVPVAEVDRAKGGNDPRGQRRPRSRIATRRPACASARCCRWRVQGGNARPADRLESLRRDGAAEGAAPTDCAAADRDSVGVGRSCARSVSSACHLGRGDRHAAGRGARPHRQQDRLSAACCACRSAAPVRPWP
jgi:hypothetical protein